MKKNRIISSLLCLSLAAGLLIPGLPAYAEGEGESGSNSGMKLSKTAKANDDGTYTITLEAYATGQKVISQVNKDVPTDIVLVLDQSGSMAQNMSSAKAYAPYENESNSSLRKERFNGGDENLYYPLGDGYVQVSVDRGTVQDYTDISANTKNSEYYDNRTRLYIKDEDGNYQQVTVSRELTYDGYQYTYKVNNQTILVSTGRNTVPDFNGYGPLYQPASVYKYTYYYQLPGEDRVVIETSTGADTVPNETFYHYGTVNTSRLQALKSAVTTFANSVATKAAGADGQLGTKDDIDHRVAVVGFASETGYGNNTELLSIAGSNSGSVGVAYGSISDQNLKDVLQDMSTQPGQTMVTNAINALAAEGATEVDLGMDMAQRILEKNPVPEGQERNRVVVVFTDGSPTTFDGFEMAVANRAINKANTIKADGAKVYAVGIFSGADPTTAGKSDGNTTEKSNWFMQKLSSNNGTPQTPSYYLSAADSNTLNNIFQQIADNIETGGTTTTLGESAVIKDIISPQFQLPAGATAANITLETYSYTGENQWSKNDGVMGAKASVDGDKVNVTGFDFAGNWCGTENNNGTTTYRGDKLVISFTVSPKTGFLGGNNVYTNTSAGVYEDANASSPVLEFNRPQVNVPIKDVTVTAADKNVYLLGTVTAAQLQEGATVKVGDVPLDLSKTNDAEKPYGLEKWQTEYVKINVQITDKDGKEVTTPLSQLKDDTTYTITVTVTPNSDGKNASGTAATEKSGNDGININVYKPELTYKDSEVFYGDDVPTDFDTNNRIAPTKWKHDGFEADITTMGPAPALTVTYEPEASKIDENNKIASTKDIQVAATVKIESTEVTDNTTFLHTACAEGVTCGWSETTLDGDPAFLLHVKTATLTITKTGADGNKNEGFIFKVEGPENFRVSVKDNGTVTITGLPLGTYTVTEETGWSWRYTAEDQGSAELTKDKPKGTVIIQNKKDKPYLLDGSDYAQNISKPSAGN